MPAFRLFRLIAILATLLVGAGSAVSPALGAEAVPTNVLPQHLVSDGGSFDVALTSKPRVIPLNEMFELTIDVHPAKSVKDPNPIWISVNATMPAHQHGMNTRPRIEDLGKGKFVVRGLLFHMAGEWEVAIDVAKGGVREHIKTAITLE